MDFDIKLDVNLSQMTKPIDSQEKKRTCKFDFAVAADLQDKPKYLELARKLGNWQ